MAVGDMLTLRGMRMLGNKGPTRDRALFDCASHQTQGSSAATVHEAVISDSFLIWPFFFLHGFSNALLYSDLSRSRC